MAINAIEYDIPGSRYSVGITDQFNDYAIRRHLVKGNATGELSRAALHTALGGSWQYHHIITSLPLQRETTQYFGPNMWIIEQVYARSRTSGWADANNGKRQELRFSLDYVPVFIRSDRAKRNGLPFVTNPAANGSDFFCLPLDVNASGTVIQTPRLRPVSYQYERPILRITDQRTYSTYPLTDAQIAALGMVNVADITINSVGRTIYANEARFVGADFVMTSDGTSSSGRWAGAYYFDVVKGGWYSQVAWFDTSLTGTSNPYGKWVVANALQFATADFTIF